MAGVKKYFVYDNNEAAFPSCHASTLTYTKDGKILIAWFGGSYEGAADVAVYTCVCDNNNFSKPVEICSEAGVPHWNPVLFTKDDGEIVLFYKTGKTIQSWATKMKRSFDNGITWSNPQDTNGYGPVRNKIVKLSNGAYIAPSSTENEFEWLPFVDISTDNFNTWKKSEIPFDFEVLEKPDREGLPNKAKGLIQPTVWESKGGNIHSLLRSTYGYCYRSDSDDFGNTWGKAYKTSIPNNNSAIDLAKHSDSSLILVYNPVNENFGKRTPLVVDKSVDNGATWQRVAVLEDESGEFSYPAIISNGHSLHITYTWNRKKIAFCEIKV